MMHVDSEFSLAAMIRSHCADSWGKISSYELAMCSTLAGQRQPSNGSYWRVPDNIFNTRDLNAGIASAGGYLASQKTIGYVHALQAASVVAGLCTPVEVDGGGLIVPRGATPVTTTWLATETQQSNESTPSFGAAAGTPKIISAFCEISRQLLLQSNAEEVLRAEMRNAAAVELDRVIIQGSGASGQPLGIVNTAGIGAFTGASLNQAALRNAQADLISANAVIDASKLAYITTPAVAETLSTRQRFTGSDRALWEGSLVAGVVEGVTAKATTTCPSATMVHGDFSSVWLAQWPAGIEILVDPFTKFAQGIVGVRMLIAIDVLVVRAPAFTVATSIS
jgi:HK97 family phage major capsid protein